MTVRRSATGTGIPPCLIPHAIARQFHKQCEDVCHTSAKRVCLHYCTITARTKSPKRKLRPRHARDPPSYHEPGDKRDHGNRDGDSGSAP